MSGAGGDDANPLPNPKNYWADRTAGWSAGAPDGTSTDDTFDRALIEASAIVPGMDVLDLAAGSGDPSVTIALQQAGKEFDLMLYPKMMHGPATMPQVVHKRKVEWRSIQRYLLDGG